MELSDNYISCERRKREKFLLEDTRDSGRDKGKKESERGMIVTGAKITSAYLKRSLIDSRERERERGGGKKRSCLENGKIWKIKEGRTLIISGW